MWAKIKQSIAGIYDGNIFSYGNGQIVNLPDVLFHEFCKKGIAEPEADRPVAEMLPERKYIAEKLNYYKPNKKFQKK